MKNQNSADPKTSLGKLEETLELYLVKKAPFQIPANIKELIAKFGPWLILIGIVFALPMILTAFGLGAVLAPLGVLAGAGLSIFSILSTLVLVVVLILEAMAIPGLLKRSIKGWNLLYYSTLLNAVSNLISFNLGGLIIGSLISFYILFQIKELYK